MARNTRILSFVGVMCLLTGCGPSGPVFAPVSGSVTLDGAPMEDGIIYFKRPELGAVDRLEIKQGKFSGMVEVGDRRVEICRLTLGKPFKMGAAEFPNHIETISPQFNRESTLTANVSESGTNEFSFDVTSKPGEEGK